MIIKREVVKDVPILHIFKQELSDEKLPLIFFIHGFMSAKEHNLHYAYYLAEQGFRVVLPEVSYHGERSQNLDEAKLYTKFWPIIIQSIHELNILKEYMVETYEIAEDKVGVVGTSMGGIITNGAVCTYDWITTAVSLMGNPAYVAFAEYQAEQMQKLNSNFSISQEEISKQLEQLKPYDLSLNPDKLKKRPMMFWHGAKDQVVPHTFAYNFYKTIKATYKDENSFVFYLDEKADHKVSREGVLQTVDWFVKNLKSIKQNI